MCVLSDRDSLIHDTSQSFDDLHTHTSHVIGVSHIANEHHKRFDSSSLENVSTTRDVTVFEVSWDIGFTGCLIEVGANLFVLRHRVSSDRWRDYS